MSHQDRRRRLAEAVEDVADAVLVTDLVNVRYLTGFTGSNAAVLVTTANEAVLATDGRYLTQAAAQAPDVEVLPSRRLGPELVARAVGAGARRVAVERRHVTLTAYDALTAAAADAAELVDAAEAVEALRIRKDGDELDALRAACRITDEVFATVLDRLRPGATEQDVAWALRVAMHERGAEPAFDAIVAFGPHSAIPHHQPTDRPLAPGDLVKLDFGAQVHGYHADMTRTVVVGSPAAWQRELHDAVREMQQRARARVVPGAVPVELDDVVRDEIRAAGYDVAHGLGHGVGLQIHEAPFLVAGSAAAPLELGVPVTVEPGVYLPGRGGVRIEDTVLLGPEGAEPLTTSPRELLEV
jgi:Xaa-Pro aminopeptidase